MKTRFVAGLLGAPHGLAGFIKLRPLSGEGEHFLRLQTVTLRREGWEGGEKKLPVEEVRQSGRFWLVKFRGVESPEAARALAGSEVLVSREEAAPLGAGEFYVEDLRGLAVCGPGGEALGTVRDVVDAGGGSLIEVGLTSGAARFVPFRKEFVGEVDVEAGRLELLAPWVLE